MEFSHDGPERYKNLLHAVPKSVRMMAHLQYVEGNHVTFLHGV